MLSVSPTLGEKNVCQLKGIGYDLSDHPADVTKYSREVLLKFQRVRTETSIIL